MTIFATSETSSNPTQSTTADGTVGRAFRATTTSTYNDMLDYARQYGLPGPWQMSGTGNRVSAVDASGTGYVEAVNGHVEAVNLVSRKIVVPGDVVLLARKRDKFVGCAVEDNGKSVFYYFGKGRRFSVQVIEHDKRSDTGAETKAKEAGLGKRTGRTLVANDAVTDSYARVLYFERGTITITITRGRDGFPRYTATS